MPRFTSLALMTSSLLLPSLVGAKERPNIIVFFADDLDKDYLSCNGGKYQTPAIDQLAFKGVSFTRAYVASSVSTPSRFALLTGSYPSQCNSKNYNSINFPGFPALVDWNTDIEKETLSLPRILSENGYFTGMVGKWHLAISDDIANLPKIPKNSDLNSLVTDSLLKQYQLALQAHVKKSAGFDAVKSVLYANFEDEPIDELKFHHPEWITQGALSILDEASKSKKPFFLYAGLTSIHGPQHQATFYKDPIFTPEGKNPEYAVYRESRYLKLKEVQGLSSVEQHRTVGMWYLDGQVRSILEKVRSLGMDKNTIVIFLADHGVEPAKGTCYEKGIQVPLIISGCKIKQNVQCKEMVQSIDIFPTLMELAKIKQSPIFQGESLVGLLEGKSSKIHDYVYSEVGYTRAVCDGKYKYIAFRYPTYLVEQMKTGQVPYAIDYLNSFKIGHSRISVKYYPSYFDYDQFFDLSKDPYEQHNEVDNEAYKNDKLRLQTELMKHVQKDSHPFNFQDTAFMVSPFYKELVKTSKSFGIRGILWYKRDHGDIVWPPKN